MLLLLNVYYGVSESAKSMGAKVNLNDADDYGGYAGCG